MARTRGTGWRRQADHQYTRQRVGKKRKEKKRRFWEPERYIRNAGFDMDLGLFGLDHLNRPGTSTGDYSYLSQPPPINYDVTHDFEDEEETEEELLFGSIRGNIVGIQYYRGTVNNGEMVSLVREPKNQYDSNAIKVTNVDDVQVGHVKRELAKALTKVIDLSLARVEGTVPFGATNVYSMPVDLSLWGKPENKEAAISTMKSSGFALRESVQPTQLESEVAGYNHLLATTRVLLSPLEIKGQLDKLFENLEEGDKTSQSEPAKAIVTPMYPHQKQALHWMMERENKHTLPPFWEKQGTQFYNSITVFTSNRKPKSVLGGILADDMGLGKTLEMIALILTNFEDGKPLAVPVDGFVRAPKKQLKKSKSVPISKSSDLRKSSDTPSFDISKKKVDLKRKLQMSHQSSTSKTRGDIPPLPKLDFDLGVTSKEVMKKIKIKRDEENKEEEEVVDNISEDEHIVEDNLSADVMVKGEDLDYAPVQTVEPLVDSNLPSPNVKSRPRKSSRRPAKDNFGDSDDIDESRNEDESSNTKGDNLPAQKKLKTAESAVPTKVAARSKVVKKGKGPKKGKRTSKKEPVQSVPVTENPVKVENCDTVCEKMESQSDKVDESKVFTTNLPNGILQRVLPDGCVETVFPSGIIQKILPTGIVKTIMPSQEVQTIMPSPDVQTVKPSPEVHSATMTPEDKSYNVRNDSITLQSNSKNLLNLESKVDSTLCNSSFQLDNSLIACKTEALSVSDTGIPINPCLQGIQTTTKQNYCTEASKACHQNFENISSGSIPTLQGPSHLRDRSGVKGCNFPVLKRAQTCPPSRLLKLAVSQPAGDSGPNTPETIELPDLSPEIKQETEKEAIDIITIDSDDELPDLPVIEKCPEKNLNVVHSGSGANTTTSEKSGSSSATSGQYSGRTVSKGPRGTLIICPLSVMSNWVNQFEDHLHESVILEVYMYYGANRITDKEFLENQDIVLTTYSTIAVDAKGKHPLRSVEWLRIVLDEGHAIRNPAAQQTKAVIELRARRKWILTGTPIQNSMKDLWSLINFLNISPFTHKEWWNRTIERPLASGEEKALKRVRHLMGMIALRRTKTQEVNGKPLVELPEKNIFVERIKLGDDERQVYDAMQNSGQLVICKYFNQGTLLHHYGEVLVILMRLRQLCCHPQLVAKAAAIATEIQNQATAAVPKDMMNDEVREQLVKTLLEVLQSGSDEECSICLESLRTPVITRCAHVYCRTCIEAVIRNEDPHSKCPMCRCDIKADQLVNVPPDIQVPEPATYSDADWQSSAKVDAMMNALISLRQRDPTAKSMVVSQFTSLLRLLEIPLRKQGFVFTKFVGSMSSTQREESIDEFSETGAATPTVMLLSLKAGGVGINLTAANNVFLMDPAWNPASEEQCFDRCHRLGQTKDVTVTKFVIEDSVEERMLELQEKKRKLMQGAFGKNLQPRKEELVSSTTSRICLICETLTCTRYQIVCYCKSLTSKN